MDAAAPHSELPNEATSELIVDLLEEGYLVKVKVTGSSMSPFVCSGDELIVEPISGHRPRFGEVVAFVSRPRRLVVHRVVRERSRSLVTRGDGAAAKDQPVATSEVCGRVMMIKRDGSRLRFGLGRERIMIAALSRWGLLRPLMKLARSVFPRELMRRYRSSGSITWADPLSQPNSKP